MSLGFLRFLTVAAPFGLMGCAMVVGMDGLAVAFRVATEADLPAIAACRLPEGTDERMGAYFRGEHHPGGALGPRVGYVALVEGSLAGFVAGHLSTRAGCEGEVQYLFVALAFRRRGVGRMLVERMLAWFAEEGARRICVCVDAESLPAEPFYLALGFRPISAKMRWWFVWEGEAHGC